MSEGLSEQCLHFTGEVDIFVTFSFEIFSRFGILKVIKIG